jgi:hypothetical protein
MFHRKIDRATDERFELVLDPDPDQHGSTLIWLSWIRIRICIGSAGPDPGPWKITKINK